ncbi:hypothetical protein LX95_01870 [Mesonia algae]|uniref:Uncharacterized protein n=1 Tax=Mesonia algae TaxID=213248 RepID=A0A2W7HYF8_9FLAO|nr:hypothetical protein [Mesonia algae]PZW39514.1 hypothetical protein LX95_01870 [Mesonia algae]
MADLNVVRVLDVSEPQYPNFVSSIPITGFDLIIREDELFVIGEEQLTQYELGVFNDEFTSTEISEITF